MSRAEYELVARVGKARGLEGEVTATVAGDLPFCVYEGLQVYVVPPSLYGKRELTVQAVEDGSGSTYRLKFDQIDSIDEAEGLAGRYLLARTSDIQDAYADMPSLDMGRAVIDERYGELGIITGIIETPANDVWVIDGQYGEVLVPIIDDLILEYPEEQSMPIRTQIMDGLIEL